MIGEQIGETKGKRTVRRVISVDPPTAEVSFEDTGTMLGIANVTFKQNEQHLAIIDTPLQG